MRLIDSAIQFYQETSDIEKMITYLECHTYLTTGQKEAIHKVVQDYEEGSRDNLVLHDDMISILQWDPEGI